MASPHENPDPILLTTKEIASDLGITDWVIRKWASEGVLPPHGTRGRETPYRLDDVIKAETRRRQRVSVERLEHLPLLHPKDGRCVGPYCCPEPVVRGAPVPLCRNHLLECSTFVYDTSKEYKAKTRRLEPKTGQKDSKLIKAAGRKDVVYFVRFGDRVKIGYSANFQRRMSEVPYDEILLLLPGTTAHERGLHEIFKEHRITGEWFHAHPDIMEFVKEQKERAAVG